MSSNSVDTSTSFLEHLITGFARRLVTSYIRICLYHRRLPNKTYSSPKKSNSKHTRGGGNCKFTSGLGTFGAAVVIGKSTLLRGSNENLLTIRYFLGRGGRSNMLVLNIFDIFLLHRQNLHFSPQNMASTTNIYEVCPFLGDTVTNAFHGDLPSLYEVHIVE